MKNCVIIMLLLFVLSPLLSFGQGEEIVMKGIVVDADSLTPLPFVHVSVINRNQGMATSAEGQFHLRVSRNDTVVFSSVGYHPFILLPADSTIESLQHLRIPMTAAVSELEEVTVKAYEDISRYIKRTPKPFSMERSRGTPLFEKKEAQQSPSVGVATGMNGAALEGALTAFANLFSSKFQQEKKLKQLLQLQEAEARQLYLRQIMTEKYLLMLADISSLDEEQRKQFTEMYMPDPELMLSRSDYDILVEMLEHLETYETFEEEDSMVEEILKNAVFEGQEKGRN